MQICSFLFNPEVIQIQDNLLTFLRFLGLCLLSSGGPGHLKKDAIGRCALCSIVRDIE